MSDIAAERSIVGGAEPQQGLCQEPSYLTAEHGILAWLFTTDHKRIALLYAAALTVFFFIGGAAAVAIRMELFTPRADLLSADGYNRMFTLHGTVMVWFFLVPSIPSTLGNFLLPLMIGARDVAFPRLNLLSWYIFIGAGALLVGALLAGGVDTGWTFYTPFSTTYSHSYVMAAALAVVLVGFSSIATGVNFIATVHMLRAPGMTWFRLPLLVWAIYGTSLVIVLATPVLTIVLVLIVAERALGLPIFDPARGGDPVLFQHLFWFYSHPAVYIMILPGFGVMSELISCFSRRRIFGYWGVAGSSVSIAVIGFFVWGHHMFITGMSVYGGLVFSFLSFLVAIPSAIKVLNWTMTLRGGSVAFKTPMLYALGFLGVFVIGGLTGLFLATLAVDVHVTDTYFVVAHFHYIMVGGMVTAFLGGVHFWFPKATGKLYPEWAGRIAAVTIFFGFNLTFFPQFVLGYLGWSLLYGKPAGPNPWKAMGMEWTVDSPPPRDNFARTPVVTQEPYAYHAMTPQGGAGPILPTGGHNDATAKQHEIEWSGQ